MVKRRKRNEFTPLEMNPLNKGEASASISMIRKKHPLPLGGFTAFQKKVYAAVQKIPKGQTRSYKWVAEQIGSPAAYRAVGQALNRNPYPGIIPCHRVIRSDGSCGGYSRGEGAKKGILKREGIFF